MKRESVFLMVFLMILVTNSFMALEVQRVEAEPGTIYIRADGSIDPPDAPISTFDNVTYTLTGKITSDADGIVVERDSIMVDGSGFAVEGTGAGTTIGIHLDGRSNVTVKNINIAAFWYGVYLNSSSSNSVDGNNMANNVYGIGLDYSSNNSVSRNNITANILYGIRLYSSSDNNVSGNNITANNMVGIELGSYSRNNSVTGNDVADTYYGISLYYSSDNSVYHNNFVNNAWPVASEASINVWDDGYPSGGNYWSDYNRTDANQDGIGDTPYVIDANNTDHYPLMGMFYSINITFLPGSTVTLISNSTISLFDVVTVIENIEPETSKGIPTVFINFTDQTGFGFCRVSIPHALMNISNTPVTIDQGSTTVLAPNYMLYDNGTQRWIYFAYEQSPPPINQTSRLPRIMIIPEFPSFLILPLFFMATSLAVISYKRKQRMVR